MLGKFRDSVKDLSSDLKSKVAEKELDEDTLEPLLEQFRLKLLQNNVSLEAAEDIEQQLEEELLGEEVARNSVEERVEEALEEALLGLLDDSYNLERELEEAEKPPVIFLVGFNGSGKCISTDSEVYTGSGPVPIQDLFEKYSDLEINETEKGRYVEPDDLNVYSVDQENLKSELKSVSKLWQLETEQIVDIQASTGKKISVTPEHPVFKIVEGAVVKHRADTLSEGDYIMAPSRLESEGSKPDLWGRLEHGLYVESKIAVEDLYEHASSFTTLKELSDMWKNLGYHEDAIQYSRRSGKIPLEVLKETDLEIPKDAEFSASEAQSMIFPQEPSEELAEWLGMLVAEGNIDSRSVHIHNKNEEFVSRLKTLYRDLFDIDPTLRETDGLYRVSTGKKTLEKFLEQALGMEGGKHSMVEEITGWPESCQAGFLKGMFSGDSHVSKTKREIELATSEEKTASNLQFMLLNQGIISSRDEKRVEESTYYRIRVNGDSKLAKWKQKIGFSIDYKRKDLERALNSSKQYEHTELVPEQGAVLKHVRENGELTQRDVAKKLGVENSMIHHYENDSRIDPEKLKTYSDFADGKAAKFLDKVAESDVSWLKVESVEKRECNEPVYDLTVPDNHNFVANGLTVHNTTTAAKLANDLKDRGVVLGAGDTFRAASIEQLEEHGEELGVEVVSHEYESDPAAVAYDTVEHAEKEDRVAIVDTAGRSHSDKNLMNELEKMIDVNDPDVTFLVVDALAGNDVMEQAEAYEGMFDAVIVTKMDVDENGGAIISISQKSGKPVAFIGRGQGYGDLEEFEKESFVRDILD